MKIKHYSFNKYLYHFNIINNSNCEYEKRYETMKYYLLKYTLYEKKRDWMRRKIKIEEMRMSKFLDDFKLV